MSTRTIRFYGQGYSTLGSDQPATVMAKLNGVIIYEGAIPSVSSTEVINLTMANITNVMFTTTIDSSFTGEQLFSITPTNGWVVTGDVKVNYFTTANPIYTKEDHAILANVAAPRSDKIRVMAPHAIPPFTDAELAILGTMDIENQLARTEIITSRNLKAYDASADSWGRIYNNPADVFSNVTIGGTSVGVNCIHLEDGVETIASNYSTGTLPRYLLGGQQMVAMLNITATR